MYNSYASNRTSTNMRAFELVKKGLGILVLSTSWLGACRSSSAPEEDATGSPQVNAYAAGSSGELPVCSSDTECQTGFCDQVSCAKPDVDRTRYGAQCAEDSARDQCAGYLCQEGRCRSCASDDECIGGNARGPSRCYAYPERPGRSCGLPPPDAGPDPDVMPPPDPVGGSPTDDKGGQGGGGTGGRGLVGTQVDPPPDWEGAGAAGAPPSE